MIELLAFVACAILAALTVFQFLLILGFPLGKYTQGGYHEVLPTSQRIICAASIVLYVILALIILNQAGLTNLFNSVSNIGIWIFTIFFFIGTFMNAISRSKPERNIMTPVALFFALVCLLFALN